MVDLDDMTAWLNDRLSILDHDPVEPHPLPEIGVVGVDGSEDSQKAASWAHRLTNQVHLVYGEACGHQTLGASPEALAGLSKDARFAFDLVTPLLEDLPVKEHVLDASPARAIAEVTEALGADLILVGSRDDDAHAPELSSVSQTLVHHSPYPVLLSRRGPGAGPVVLALGEDRSSRPAAAWALRLADATDRTLLVLHSAPRDIERIELEGFADQHEGLRSHLVDWRPAKGILAFLEEHRASLLVVGHGRHRSWLGSTALELLRAAPAAVLAVPEPR